MIELIIRLLSIDDFYSKSENIDIAKGKYKRPMTIKEGMKQRKRWQ
jgi:hypothetical protein